MVCQPKSRSQWMPCLAIVFGLGLLPGTGLGDVVQQPEVIDLVRVGGDGISRAVGFEDQVALPFTFPFAGRDIVAISVNTSGLVQLLESGESCAVVNTCKNVLTHKNGEYTNIQDAIFAPNGRFFGAIEVSATTAPQRVTIDLAATTANDQAPTCPIRTQVQLYGDGRIRWNFRRIDWCSDSPLANFDMFAGFYQREETTVTGVAAGALDSSYNQRSFEFDGVDTIQELAEFHWTIHGAQGTDVTGAAAAPALYFAGDDTWQTWDLPFPFPFFDQLIPSISLNSNGLVELLEAGESCSECGDANTKQDGDHWGLLDVIFASNGDLISSVDVIELPDRVQIEWLGYSALDSGMDDAIHVRLTLADNGWMEWAHFCNCYNIQADLYSGAFAASGGANSAPVGTNLATPPWTYAFVQPVIDVQPSAVNFGLVGIGTTVTQTVAVRNIGTSVLDVGILGGIDPLAFPYTLVNNQCDGIDDKVPPGQQCSFDIRFQPSLKVVYDDSIDVASNLPTVTVNVSGTGASPYAELVIQDSSGADSDRLVDFGLIPAHTQATATVTLGNAGTVPLAITDVQSNLPGAFLLNDDSCSGQSLAAGGGCNFSLVYSPTAAGAHTGTIEIDSNDGSGLVASIDVSGTSLANPAVALVRQQDANPDDGILAFGDVATNASAQRAITISSTGTRALALGDLDVSAPLSPGLTTNADTCSNSSLVPGASCEVLLTFAPADPGVTGRSLTWFSNQDSGQPVTVTVVGTGIEPAAAATTVSTEDGDPSDTDAGGDAADQGQNQPPGAPVLISPVDGQTGLPETVTFRWQAGIDPDGDTVIHRFHLCTNRDFSGCSATIVAGASGGTAPLMATLAPFLLIAGLLGRRPRWLACAILIAAGGAGPACQTTPSGGTHVTHIESGLLPNATYYWKVTASDGRAATDSETRSFGTASQ